MLNRMEMGKRMNCPHDLGGQPDLGPLPLEDEEPVFHSEWERRVLAVTVASAAMFGSIDRRRHALELLDQETYLRCSYYERWLERFERLGVSDGWLTESELENGKATSFELETMPLAPDRMEATIRAGRPSDRDVGIQEPMFEVGQRVRAKNLEPTGHTRLPPLCARKSRRYTKIAWHALFPGYGYECA
ncbi:MAG: nitrile hydratase subunit beta [Candidatus Rariloculaceae bacterium]